MNKGLEDLVDLMFDTDMEEVMKEKSTLEYIHKLQQENKQLKEELESKNKMYWQQQCAYYSSILYSLEEWLKEEIKNIKNNYSQVNGNYFNMNYKIETYEDILDKIQKLKEKYK